PTSTNDSISVKEDLNNTNLGYALLLTDFGDYSDVENNPLSSVRIETLPTNGKFYLNGVEVTAANFEVTAADITAGKLTFVPTQHTDTDGSFTFSVSDGTNWSSEVYTTVIILEALADKPELLISISTPVQIPVSSTGNPIDFNDLASSLGIVIDGTVTGTDLGDSLMNGVNNTTNDYLLGKGGADAIHGYGGDDIFDGGAGNDSMYGGEGKDVAIFTGKFSDYIIEYRYPDDHGNDAYLLVIDKRGIDTDSTNSNHLDAGDHLYSIETLVFSDMSVYVDLSNGNMETNSAFKYELNIDSSLVDRDGSETLSITLSGIPDSVSVVGATKNPDGTWSLTVSGKDFNGAITLIASESQSNFDVTVTARSTESSNNSTAIFSQIVAVIIPLVTGTKAPTITSVEDETVYEHGLVDGNSNSGAEFTSGSFIIKGESSDIVSIEIEGQSISLSQLESLSSTDITIITDKGVFTLTDYNSSTGELSYTYKLSSSQNHTNNIDIKETIDLVLENAQGLKSSTSFDITIVDDAPSTTGDTQFIVFEEQITNVIIILDASGSMAYDMSSSDDRSRMKVAIQAIKQLLEAYDDLGSVNVQLVSFSSTHSGSTNAHSNGWLNLADAKAWLDTASNVDPDGGTDYVLGLNSVINNFTAPQNGGKTYTYFISDGEPWSNQNKSDALAFEDDWEAFINANGITESYAIGMGNVPTEYLSIAAHANGVDTAVTLVYSADDLKDHLLSTIVVETTGHIFDGLLSNGSIIGADGGTFTSVTIDGQTYTLANAINGILVINTALGGKLTVDFNKNEYSYEATALSNNGQDYIETFTATMTDNDGDSSSAEFTINVAFPDHTQGTSNTDVLYGTTANDTLNGLAGNDAIMGEAGNDTLEGGAGHDILVGGSGNDIFKFGANSGDRSTDTIVDFTAGDIIDLSDLLVGESANAYTLNSYLNFTTVDGDTRIFVDSDKDGAVDLTIRLQDLDLGATGSNDVDIIQTLLTQGQLVVDNTSSRSSRRTDTEDEARDGREYNSFKYSTRSADSNSAQNDEMNTINSEAESDSLMFNFSNDQAILGIDSLEPMQSETDDELKINPNEREVAQFLDLNTVEAISDMNLTMSDLVKDEGEEIESLDTYLNLSFERNEIEGEITEAKQVAKPSNNPKTLEISEHQEFELIQKLIDDIKLSHD
ncbi:type I secretion C-terminal target domain-containing protein, partial [Pseudoalteromonas sp. '520P1 No. 412']